MIRTRGKLVARVTLEAMGRQLRLPYRGAVLSRTHGGLAQCRSYCLYWESRPEHLDEMVLCSGVEGFWDPCPDYPRCWFNPFVRKPSPKDPSQPRPDYRLRSRKGESDG
jgi:hypothetical protein